MTLKPTHWAAIGGGVAALAITGLGAFLKVRELSSPARQAAITADVQRIAQLEADRYIGAVWGLTPARIQALSRRFGG